MRYFRSIHVLREKAGFRGRSSVKTNVDLQKIANKYREFSLENGYGQGAPISKVDTSIRDAVYYYNYFNSLSDLRVMAGFSPIRKRDTSPDLQQMINEYRDFSLKNGYENGAPASAFNKEIRSLSSYLQYFGTLNNLRVKAGFKPVKSSRDNFKKPDLEELIIKYRDFSLKHGYENGAPQKAFGKNTGMMSFSTYIKYFGSLSNLRLKAGFIPSEKPEG